MSILEVGSNISLISNSNIRYEGKVFTVDPKECTIALYEVQCFGTEDRPSDLKVPAQSRIYNYILFHGSDIKDIIVITSQILHSDPAVIQSVPQTTMADFNSNHQSMDALCSVDQVGNSYNFMSDVNLNAGRSYKQANVLDLLSSSSRSSTPAQPNALNGQRNSLTIDQSVQTVSKQSCANGRRRINQRNRLISSSDTRKQVRQREQNYQLSDQHYQRDNQYYERNDFQHQDNNLYFGNHQIGNGNVNVRNWNNHQNNQQKSQQQPEKQQPPRTQKVRRHNNIMSPNATRGRSFYNNRSTGRPASCKSQESRTNSLKFDEDYDFDKANSEFQEIINKLSRTKIDDGFDNTTENIAVENGGAPLVNGDSKHHKNYGEKVAVKIPNFIDSGNKSSIVKTENEDDDQKVFYDKSVSFFDFISCETVEKNKGHSLRTDWLTERKLNSETFSVIKKSHGRGKYYKNNRNNNGPTLTPTIMVTSKIPFINE